MSFLLDLTLSYMLVLTDVVFPLASPVTWSPCATGPQRVWYCRSVSRFNFGDLCIWLWL